jgi:hypothetical protein
MDKNLSISTIGRQNVLNNRFAVESIQQALNVEMLFDRQYCFTKQMVVDFYKIDERTIKRYIKKYAQELRANGYFLFGGNGLKKFKLQFGQAINVPTKTTFIGLFIFRTFLQ